MEANDKKGLCLVGLVLILLIGVLAGTRGCDKVKYEDDIDHQKVPVETPLPTLTPSDDKTEEETPVVNQSDISYYSVNQETIKNQEIGKPEIPTIDLSKYLSNINSNYQVEVSEDFTLPFIFESESVKVQVEYFFKELYDSTYSKVLDFNTFIPGTYKIIYTVSKDNESLSKEVYVDILDTTLPVIEGIIENHDTETGITSYEPVKTGSIINQAITISFRDNHEVTYAEYYKAKYEIIEGSNKVEQEGMQEIVEIDLDQDFILYEDGEYHIRAYDYSNNVVEYVVTIDREAPIIKITSLRLDKDSTLVTIVSRERLQEKEGWLLSSDGLSLSRIYSNNQEEEVSVSDLALNISKVTIKTDHLEATIKLFQDNKETNSINLNTNDGEILVKSEGTEGIILQYSFDDSEFSSYQGEILTDTGHYVFHAVLDGILLDSIEFNISDMTVGD